MARLSDATYIVSLLLAIPAKTGFRLLNAIYEANSRNFAKIKVSLKYFAAFHSVLSAYLFATTALNLTYDEIDKILGFKIFA